MADHVSIEICGDGVDGSVSITHGSLSESGRAGIVVYGDPTDKAATVNQGDVYGPPMVEIGQLSDGSYGLAAVNPAGQLVKLNSFVFGPAAASDPSTGTRTGTLVNTHVYGDLDGGNNGGVGPELTVMIGDTGRALVIWSVESFWGSPFLDGIGAWASVEVSGATSIPASSAYCSGATMQPVNEALVLGGSKIKLFTGLTPGLNTFTLKYAAFGVAGGTPTVGFKEREIAVFPY